MNVFDTLSVFNSTC